jgi:D-alanyl-D-alanine carboxypeptidase
MFNAIRGFVLALLSLVLLVQPALAIPRLLIDTQTGEVLYDEDAGVPWHPASLTKMMTAYVAFAALQAGRVTLDTPVKISRNAWNQAPAKSGLPVGASVTMKDALYIMLVKSANDMAIAIAETVSGSSKDFVGEMNKMAGAMGLSATHYVNPNGLHAEGQITSARDLAMLGLYIRRDFPQYLPIFQTEKVRLGKSVLESNNGLLEHFAGTTGMKTGYICNSGLNIVATVERDGRSLLAVVLGGSSARERNEMAAEMFLRGLSGAYPGEGKSVVTLANLDQPPVDMRQQICGKKAKAYIAERQKAFPMGLKGKPSYLNDEIEGLEYAAAALDPVQSVPLPRTRPTSAPVGTPAATDAVAAAD